MKKKICLVHYSSAPGGIEILMPEIIRMLPEFDFSVFVIRPPVSGDINVYEHSSVKIIYGSANNYIAAFRLWRFISENAASIFHSFNTGPFFMLVIQLAGVKKAVYSIRGTLHYKSSFQKAYRRLIWRMAVTDSYRLIANSEYSRDKFLDFTGLRKKEVAVLYNPVSSARLICYSSKEKNPGFNMIYVGRLTEGKNLYRWIDVAVSLHKERSDTSFTVYGDGPLRESLTEYCIRQGAGEYISFMGHVQNVSDAYHQADLLLFLSEYESFGNVVVESILCGTPVIASDIPSMREIFRRYPQFLVSLDQDLDKAILGKINAISELNKLMPEVTSEFRERFSTENHISGLHKIYERFS